MFDSFILILLCDFLGICVIEVLVDNYCMGDFCLGIVC